MLNEKSKKPSKVFYDLCYDQYKFTHTETDQLYQRVSFVLVLLSLLGTIVVKLGRIEIFTQIFARVDIFFYYFSMLAALLLLAASVCFAILFALPRKRKYGDIALMSEWQKWRDDYKSYQDKKKDLEGEPIDDAMLLAITPKLADAQATNAPLNEKRRRYFHWCVLMASLSIVPVSIEAFFYLLLKLQGILK